jgi:hypothetical protein
MTLQRVIAAIVLALALTACGTPAAHPHVKPKAPDYGTPACDDGTLGLCEMKVTLIDGHTITCIEDRGQPTFAMSCNWVGVGP